MGLLTSLLARLCKYYLIPNPSPRHLPKTRGPTLRLNISTFPIDKPPPRHKGFTTKVINCHRLEAPPDALLERYTGLNSRVERAFFSIPKNNSAFKHALQSVKGTIRHWNFAKGADLNVPVACKIGCHRSVAMAERIAREISLWEDCPLKVKVYVVHHTLAQVVRMYRYESEANHIRYKDLLGKVDIGDDEKVRTEYRRGVPYNASKATDQRHPAKDQRW